MRIGYARVPTAEQNPDLQEDALQKAGCEKIFRDIASGAVDSRKGLSEAIEYARDGDTLVVWKPDRNFARPSFRGRLGRGKPTLRRFRKLS
jgi:DNA invertase Pin-like site-specific DNA recombinase